MRHLVLVGEVINQTLCVFGLVGYGSGKMAFVVRIIDVEALGNEIGMGVVLGKDNGLAKPVAADHFLAFGHQMRQHLVHGIGVEQPFI
jgi:hypothetical protein